MYNITLDSLETLMNHILKQIFTVLTVLTIFICYILIQNYCPSNKQSVAVAIVEKNGKILLVLPDQANYPQTKWAFPAGTVETGENLIICLQRALKEECDISAEIGNYVGTTSFYQDKKDLELHAFRVHHYTGKIALNQKHTDFIWVAPSALTNYEIIESQLPFVKILQEN